MSDDADPNAPSHPSDAPSAPPAPHDAAQLLASEDAASGDRLGAVSIADESATMECVRRARRAGESWAAMEVEARAEQLRRAAERLLDDAPDIVHLLQRECGMTRTEALALELIPAVHRAHWIAETAPRCLADEEGHPHRKPLRDMVIRRRPHGVVAVCSPWNAPLALPLGALFEALAAGNGVVLKPSRSTPLTLRMARESIVRRGIPRDLVTIAYGGAPTGEALISSGVDRVVYAGSEASGRRLALACAARLIPLTLDLASSAPGIVARDAPLERTVAAVIAARFAHAGQRRGALQRLFVHASRYDALAAALTEAIRELRPGDPGWTTTDVGPIKRPRDLDGLEAQIADALRHGATIATGGERLGNGRLYAPTLLLDCAPEMRVMREPVSGPVLSVMRVDDERAAAAFASHPAPGAIAYVFTDDERTARDLAARIPAACVAVNDALVAESLPDGPFGADAPRGLGRGGGREGLVAMARSQSLVMSPFNHPARALHWPPYSSTREAAIDRLARAMHGRFAILGGLADLW